MPSTNRLLAIAISFALLPIAYIAFCLDDWVGISRTVLFVIIFVALGLVIGWSAFAIGRHKSFLLLPCVYILFIFALSFLELTPVKSAVRAVDEIRPGMSESEVRATIDRHFPENGRFKRPVARPPSDETIYFVLDPDDGRYNAAVVQVKFSSGKCVAAEFLSD